MKQKSTRSHMGDMGTPEQTTIHHNDVGVNKSYPVVLRFQRNPSFEGMAPHCVLPTRTCYCEWGGDIRKCEVGRKNKEDRSVHFSPHIFKTAVTTKRKGRHNAADLSRAELVELDRDYENRR